MKKGDGLDVAIVGAGVAGLTAAIRLAEHGCKVDVYEAAPLSGGRTKSFFDDDLNCWVDNGPHLMVGAYDATIKLLRDVDAIHHVQWQESLNLPLWEKSRSFFSFKAYDWLPIPLALLWGVRKLPGHDMASVNAMLRVALTMHNRSETQTVAEWLEEIRAPQLLIQDMLEVLCLGVMNEPLKTANAKTFARVLAISFQSHRHAKLGWFNKPLTPAFIQPLQKKAEALGVQFHFKHTIRDVNELKQQKVVLTLPAAARNRLLKLQSVADAEAITNIHLWFAESLQLSSVMVGMLGTHCQWLFDVSSMTNELKSGHYCVTVSADQSGMSHEECLTKVLSEIGQMLPHGLPELLKSKIVCEKRATTLVRKREGVILPSHIIDAGEAPVPGDLPATIERAVISGESVVERLFIT